MILSQEIPASGAGLWTAIYKYGGIVLFGAAMFGLGASAGTTFFNVPQLWHQERVLKGENYRLTHTTQNEVPEITPRSKDCPN